MVLNYELQWNLCLLFKTGSRNNVYESSLKLTKKQIEKRPLAVDYV